ncbi:thioesterase family protein [Nocardioides sp. C4-1]|uniref:acyl-CoA thioesterase n=1 Tax=Nocardioides sp. C4-1 TaxID=3151851 RepID=UPI003262D67D
MRHVYRCPLRWADLDLQGHVNNVVYVDYLQEARVDLMRAVGLSRTAHGDPGQDMADGVVVVRHEVTYLAPLTLRFRPVSIECWITEVRAASFTMAYEVFHDTEDGGREVYVRATTVLSPFVFAAERPRRLTPREQEALAPYLEPAAGERTPRIASVDRDGAHHFDLHVRFSDVDLYRHVNNVKYFEYFQEARIRMIAEATRDTGVTMPQIVVAQTDVDYRRPILLRPEAYVVRSRVARLGTRSMTIEAEIADGDEALSRSRVTVVFWDGAAQRSTEPPAALRDVLLG